MNGIRQVAITHHMFCHPGGPDKSRVIAISVHIGVTELTCLGGCWLGLSKIMTYIEYILITSKEYDYSRI